MKTGRRGMNEGMKKTNREERMKRRREGLKERRSMKVGNEEDK